MRSFAVTLFRVIIHILGEKRYPGELRRIFLTSVRICSLKQQHFKQTMLQVTLSPFEKVVSIYSNDSPLKIKKNVFYFILRGISC